MFDWNDLRHFLALARCGSMGAAALSIGVDQSTVQRRIAALEKSIGRPLVERRSGGYGLTAQGELLLADAEQVETAVDALQRRIRALDGSGQGHVRVASLVTVGQRIIRSGFIERFQNLYPGITVEMLMGQRVADLARGEADVAIRGGGDGGSDALIGLKLVDLPWGIYASRDFVERHGKPHSVVDLDRFGIIELADELERVPAARWMQAHARGAPIAARCGNVPSAVLAVKAGAGLAALPTVHAAREDDLICVLGPLPELAYPMYLFVHKDLRRAARISAFFEFCQRELKPVLLTGVMRATLQC
ncbi:LysR family transcriptional regulator [Reyranella soli]|uniref:LysR family transcriptional regulator n=1 Tax=Reyranella soli TaxID=1230389 RepID=UPI0014792909|nr:LysR family transcriptional regulator [Reyranella soli]